MDAIGPASEPIRRLDPMHYMESSLREKVPEYLFVGELLRALWCRGIRYIEVGWL